MIGPERFVNTNIFELKAYSSARSIIGVDQLADLVLLDANENNLVADVKSRYPDPQPDRLSLIHI